MNILFVTLPFSTTKTAVFYDDLLLEFVHNGDNVYVACANERDCGETPGLSRYKGMTVLRIPTGKITGQVGIVEKGISILLIDYQFKRAIKKYYANLHVDLILYPTPPITLVNTVKYLKKKTGARTYLLLKDIFPQNAVDLGLLKTTGLKGIIYKIFRKMENTFYDISDNIGCMSPANVKFLLDNNKDIDPKIVEICPNSINPPKVKPNRDGIDSSLLRCKYNIPEDAIIFLYGGNLGRPQGIDFLVECLKEEKNNKKVFFLIIGAGSECNKLFFFINEYKPSNTVFLDYLPKDEYQSIVDICDVGMIFLDYRFTIPNFPSRFLSYLSSAIPVLVATDSVCDMGTIAEENGFGYHCLSNDVKGFSEIVNRFIYSDRSSMGNNAWDFFINNYTVERSRRIILSHFEMTNER